MNDDIQIESDPDDDGGMVIELDADSELGKKLAWHAGHRGEHPEEFLADAIEQATDKERR